MSVRKLLENEIESELQTLEDLTFNSEEHKVAIDGLTKLLDKYNEANRIELEYQDKVESRESAKELKKMELEADTEIKKKQMEDDNKDRLVKNGLTAASIFGGFALTVWGTYKSIKFEETGSITTIMGRGFIQKLLPKK